MIPPILPRIRMHERAQRTPMNHEPRHESAELLWREEVDFEHWFRVWTDGLVPDLVDAELRD